MVDETKNRKLGELAVQARYLDSDALESALTAFENWRDAGKGKSFGRFLVDCGLMTADQVRELIADQGKQILVCSNTECGRRYNIREFKPGMNYRCKRCKSLLGHPSTSQPVTDVDEEAGDSAATLFVAGGVSDTTQPQPDDPDDGNRTVLSSVARSIGQDVTVRLASAPAGTTSDTRFGRYVDAETIARGGMGAILKAYDPDLGRPVAIKIILSGEHAHKEEVIRFLREAQITGQLVHPNIPPIHEMGQTDGGQTYFVMKLIEGKSLAELLTGLKKRSRQETILQARREHLAALVKVCDALAYAHDRGVVHRDLKPDNIMVGAFGEVLVMDWGIAKILNVDVDLKRTIVDVDLGAKTDGTVMGSVLGTPAYMAPEQAEGRVDEIDARTDIYAMGVVLYEVLTYQKPYDGKNLHEIMARVVKGRYVPPSQRAPEARIPAELDAVVAKAMSFEKRDRYRKIGEFAREIERHLAGETLEAASYTPWARAGKWVGRHKAVSVVGGVSAVLILAFIVGLFMALVKSEERRKGGEKAKLDAIASEAEKEKEKVKAETALSDVSDRGLLDEVEGEEQDAWAGFPDDTDALEKWYSKVKQLVGRREHHHEMQESLEDEKREAVSQEARARIEWRITHHERIEEGLVTLAEKLDAVTQRLEAAERLRSEVDDHRAAWEQSIRKIRRSEKYGGLVIREMTGLMPIGTDPASGLMEFWHVESGERPVRVGGKIDMKPETGIILVLVPGGTFEMGSKEQPSEQPVHVVRIEPFLISKFEVTQSQWESMAGGNPSHYHPGFWRTAIMTHPVEQIVRVL